MTEPWREGFAKWPMPTEHLDYDLIEEAYAAGDANGYARALALPELRGVLEKAEAIANCWAALNQPESTPAQMRAALAALKERTGML